MGILIQDLSLKGRSSVFDDRLDAGRRLAEHLTHYKATNCTLLAIPAGGVPVAAPISRSLGLPLDLIIARKIQMPSSAEAGFGAMDPDGEVILNERLLGQLGLTEEEIRWQIAKTREVIQQRISAFRSGRPFPSLAHKDVIVVDDGLASGYTMRAAVRFVRRREASKVIVAAPTGHMDSIQALLPEVDELVCLNIRSGHRFAVAEAYKNWYDVTDDEVLFVLKEFQRDLP